MHCLVYQLQALLQLSLNWMAFAVQEFAHLQQQVLMQVGQGVGGQQQPDQMAAGWVPHWVQLRSVSLGPVVLCWRQ